MDTNQRIYWAWKYEKMRERLIPRQEINRLKNGIYLVVKGVQQYQKWRLVGSKTGKAKFEDLISLY